MKFVRTASARAVEVAADAAAAKGEKKSSGAPDRREREDLSALLRTHPRPLRSLEEPPPPDTAVSRGSDGSDSDSGDSDDNHDDEDEEEEEEDGPGGGGAPARNVSLPSRASVMTPAPGQTPAMAEAHWQATRKTATGNRWQKGDINVKEGDDIEGELNAAARKLQSSAANGGSNRDLPFAPIPINAASRAELLANMLGEVNSLGWGLWPLSLTHARRLIREMFELDGLASVLERDGKVRSGDGVVHEDHPRFNHGE